MGIDGGQNTKLKEDLVDVVFSWSIQDAFNRKLYQKEVQAIPKTFTSVKQYAAPYIFPLLEETRAEMCWGFEAISRAPICEIKSLLESKRSNKSQGLKESTHRYKIIMETHRDEPKRGGRDVYEPKKGDIFAISEVIPKSVADLTRRARPYVIAFVIMGGFDDSPDEFKICTSKAVTDAARGSKSLFAVYLLNIMTNDRIWKALRMDGNLSIIKQVLSNGPTVGESCRLCASVEIGSALGKASGATLDLFELNESQIEAVLSSISARQCNHKHSVKLIWGPPGTGKTKTVGTLLWVLLQLKCRTITCAPTNVAVLEVTSRLLKLVKGSNGQGSCSLGDIVMFGNKDRMKVVGDLHEVFLDDRVDRLSECFSLLTGWKHQVVSMIELLEDSVAQYRIYLENEKRTNAADDAQNEERDRKEQNAEGIALNRNDSTNKTTREENLFQNQKICKIRGNEDDGVCDNVLTFQAFVRMKFGIIAENLMNCIRKMCTHLPKAHLSTNNYANMIMAQDLLESVGSLLCTDIITDKELERLFAHTKINSSTAFMLCQTRYECLRILRILHKAINIPHYHDKGLIAEFCLKNATLIFCTASSSAKLKSIVMEPLELLVIDEAAQLKECESFIPLQLRGIRHAILIGDECQLPAMVRSEISEKAGFGISLFERLGLLGHKHLLDMQYRMHPSISSFPNAKFYNHQIKDAPNVRHKSYERHFLEGHMYGPYSFINVSYGKEVYNDGHSKKNLVEVAVVSQIVRRLFKAFVARRQRLSVGIISPYTAQVVEIQKKLGKTYNVPGEFGISVKSVDGFQGGEEDVIIISTVRSNTNGSVGFLSKLQRTNVALTRARHCLWILGSGPTLVNSDSIWKELVLDAKDRGCFFNAEEDNDLAEAIIDVNIKLGHLNDLLNMESLLFNRASWRVLFNYDFWKSFVRLQNTIKKEVFDLLWKLSSGWRHNKRYNDLVDGSSFQLLRQYKVKGLYLIWAVDIMNHPDHMIQVLKFWDILPFKEIPNLVKCLDNIFAMRTEEYINRCKFKLVEGIKKLEVPMSWEIRPAVVQPDIQETELAEDLSSHLASLSLGEHH